jgi:outer membrane protein assembly factor BamA
MRTPLFASIAAFALIAAPRSITAQDGCGEQLVVSQVTMPTTTRLVRSEQAAVRARLIGRCLDDQQLGELVGQVLDTLQSLGYFRATVSAPSIKIMDASPHAHSASLSLEFQEGARYRVEDIEIAGNKGLPADQIIAVAPIQLGEFLDMTKVRETADAMRRLYASNGYPTASIVPDVRFREGFYVTVAFRIIEGKQQMD